MLVDLIDSFFFIIIFNERFVYEIEFSTHSNVTHKVVNYY